MRGKQAKKRHAKPDVRYHNVAVEGFINRVMESGKKSVARQIVYGAFDLIEKQLKKEPIKVFELAVKNVTPSVEVKPRRVGGASYQVPVEVSDTRGRSLSLRWIIEISQKRTEKTMIERLAHELMDAANNTGTAVRKREDTHKMAEANKAFAHFRW